MKILLNVLILLFGFIACDGFRDSPIGPCGHKTLNPVIEVDNVRDEMTGKIIREFKIINAKFNNHIIDMHSLTNDVSFNCAIHDSVLYCNVPCGFGSSEGEYSFYVSAIGYRDTTIIIDAQYKHFDYGCSSCNSGSSKVTFTMQKL